VKHFVVLAGTFLRWYNCAELYWDQLAVSRAILYYVICV